MKTQAKTLFKEWQALPPLSRQGAEKPPPPSPESDTGEDSGTAANPGNRDGVFPPPPAEGDVRANRPTNIIV